MANTNGGSVNRRYLELMGGLVVKPRARILHGHDWVFSSEVLKVFGKPGDGDVVSLKDGRDHLIGSAIYNSKSQIVARRFSRRKQDLDLDFFKRRIDQAAEYRNRRGLDPKLCRVVWSESDGLPGVIVDRYNNYFVLQTLTLAMDQRKELLKTAILEVFGAGVTIVERNDAPVRKAEGLVVQVETLTGAAASAPLVVQLRSPPSASLVDFEVDVAHGQKTGFYLDQKDNYGIVAEYAKERRVLDCFANQGAFALFCARSGAAEVTAVEESKSNLDIAQRNAARNGANVQWVNEDVFHFLRAAEKREAQYDLIILDPPSFTKGKGGVTDALRGYRELHLRAFKLLSKDGILATFSCSHHVSESALMQTVADALVDARRSARKIRRCEQSADHPVVATLPETEYLKGVLFEMMPGR